MLMKVLSYARKSGSFKDVKYDSIILYTLTIGRTYEGVNSSLSGHPVEFHELKIPLNRFNQVFGGSPCTFDFLDSIIGENIDVTFSMSQFNGVDRFSVDTIKIFGGDVNA